MKASTIQVIMDEVGRGTTVYDGLSIAFATLHHLVTVNGCRALFATHFHELAEMVGCTNNKGQAAFKGVGFLCTTVDETLVRFQTEPQYVNFLMGIG
jgi:DNA mismatch repair ATPase MutS